MSSTIEKTFVMKHVFENVKNMPADSFGFRGEESHFNLIWDIYVYRDENHNYLIGLDCTNDKEDAQNWSVDTELEFRLIELFLNSKYRFDEECVDWELIRVKSSQIDRYLIDGNLTVECHVKILKTDGIKGMKSKFNKESMKKFSDVVLVVDGEKFYVLKTYLASRSPYFDSLLMGQFKESNQSEVVLQGIEVDDFQNYLEILYAEPAISDQNVESVLRVADMYQTKCVLQQAEDFLLKISKKSKKEKFELAVKYNLEGLKDSIMSQCVDATKIRSLLPDDLTQLDKETVTELFKKYLSATNITAPPVLLHHLPSFPPV